jgi:hypothetical protein
VSLKNPSTALDFGSAVRARPFTGGSGYTFFPLILQWYLVFEAAAHLLLSDAPGWCLILQACWLRGSKLWSAAASIGAAEPARLAWMSELSFGRYPRAVSSPGGSNCRASAPLLLLAAGETRADGFCTQPRRTPSH